MKGERRKAKDEKPTNEFLLDFSFSSPRQVNLQFDTFSSSIVPACGAPMRIYQNRLSAACCIYLARSQQGAPQAKRGQEKVLNFRLACLMMQKVFRILNSLLMWRGCYGMSEMRYLVEHLVGDVAGIVAMYMECMVPECREMVSSPRYWFCAKCVEKAFINFTHDTSYYCGVYSRLYLFVLTWSVDCWSFRIVPHSSQTQYTNLFEFDTYFHNHQAEVDSVLESTSLNSQSWGHGCHHINYMMRGETKKWTEDNINTRLAAKDAVLRAEWELFCFQLRYDFNDRTYKTEKKHGPEEILRFATEFCANQISL